MRYLPRLAAGAAVALAALATLATAVASTPSSPRFTWADGSALPISGETHVWCGKWDDGANIRTLRIQEGSPLSPPWWMLEVRVSIAHAGHTIRFPVLNGRTATMFVAYPRRQLEASAESERSRGSVTVLDGVSCRPGALVRLAVHTTLAGEQTGTPSIAVRGTFAGVVGTTAGPGVNP